jgi:hypothetical protein
MHRSAQQRWRFVLLALLAAYIVFLVSPTVSPAALLDANCPGPPNAMAVFNSPGERRAQPFTAQRTGTLVRGQAEINKPGSSGDWTLKILATDPAGAPINTALASSTIADATVPMGASTLAATFDPPAAVAAGERYAIAVSRPANWELQRRADDPSCPGREYMSPSQTAPFTVSGTPSDMIFATFVDPPNDFSVGKLRGRNLALTVPGAGTIDVASKRRLKHSGATSSGPGTVSVALRLTKVAKQKLGRKGKLRVNASITFTPTGGTANQKPATLKFKVKIRRF